jgi:alpha-aminoadipic semialdehyde synthase
VSASLLNNNHKFRLFNNKTSLLHVSATAATQKVIAIRREDQSIWERRAPLSPNQVRKLVMKDGYKVLVQPSNRRAFQLPEYVAAGALALEDLSEASVILGVKQVPIDALLPNKTYVFFSHTIKAQEANMALLDALLEKNVMLCDYEKIVDSKNQRQVAFGKFKFLFSII